MHLWQKSFLFFWQALFLCSSAHGGAHSRYEDWKLAAFRNTFLYAKPLKMHHNLTAATLCTAFSLFLPPYPLPPSLLSFLFSFCVNWVHSCLWRACSSGNLWNSGAVSSFCLSFHSLPVLWKKQTQQPKNGIGKGLCVCCLLMHSGQSLPAVGE